MTEIELLKIDIVSLTASYLIVKDVLENAMDRIDTLEIALLAESVN